MLNFEEYKKLFENIKEDLFKDCITEEKYKEWNSDCEYVRYSLKLKQNLADLLKDNDTYHEITDIISKDNFVSMIKNVYYDEINKDEYISDVWSGYVTTYKCYEDYDGNLDKIKSVFTNKLEQLKTAFIENLTNTYEKYTKAYELKKEYIEFAENIKKAGFSVCDYQRRGELRVPCTFAKSIGTLELYVRKNANSYRIYMKCDVKGRYGMTVEEFDESYQILKQETNNIRNALMGENII